MAPIVGAESLHFWMLTEKAFAVVRGLEEELAGERARGRQLVEDFQYNLQLLRERDNLIDTLEKDVETLRGRSETFEARCRSAEQRALHAEATRAENRALREDLARARREVVDVAQSLAETRERLGELEKREAQHCALKEQTENVRATLEETRQSLRRVEDDRRCIVERSTQLESRLNVANDENSALRIEIAKIRTENAALRTAKETLEETATRLTRDLEGRDEDLQRAVGRYKHDTRQLHEAHDAAEAKLSTLRRRLKEIEARLDETTAERDNLKQTLAAERLRLAALSDVQRQDAERATTLQSLRDDLATRAVALQNAEVAQTKLRTALAIEQKEVQRLRERLAECEDELRAKEAKNGAKFGAKNGAKFGFGAKSDDDGANDGNDGNDAIIQRYKTIVSEMRAEMEGVARVMRELELERNGYKARLDTLALELDELREAHARSRDKTAQLVDARQRLSVLEGENGELRARVALLTAGEVVEPETAALLRRLQTSLREAIARLRELQTENEKLGLSNRILKERLDALTGLTKTKNATTKNTTNTAMITANTTNTTKNATNTTATSSPSLALSFDLSELPSGLSSLGDVSDLKEKMRAALDNAGLLGVGA